MKAVSLKAAAKLHVSQPTISAQISALESVLGEKLFRRAGRNLRLTDVGPTCVKLMQRRFFHRGGFAEFGQTAADRPAASLAAPGRWLMPRRSSVTHRIIEPIFRLPQPVQVSCWEAKSVLDMLVEPAAYRLDIVLADEPASSVVNAKVLQPFAGRTRRDIPRRGAKLAKSPRPGFPKSLDGAPALLPMANTGLRRSIEKWFGTNGIRPRLVGEFEDPGIAPWSVRFSRTGSPASGHSGGEGSGHSVWPGSHWPNRRLPPALLRGHTRAKNGASSRNRDRLQMCGRACSQRRSDALVLLSQTGHAASPRA